MCGSIRLHVFPSVAYAALGFYFFKEIRVLLDIARQINIKQNKIKKSCDFKGNHKTT